MYQLNHSIVKLLSTQYIILYSQLQILNGKVVRDYNKIIQYIVVR